MRQTPIVCGAERKADGGKIQAQGLPELHRASGCLTSSYTRPWKLLRCPAYVLCWVVGSSLMRRSDLHFRFALVLMGRMHQKRQERVPTCRLLKEPRWETITWTRTVAVGMEGRVWPSWTLKRQNSKYMPCQGSGKARQREVPSLTPGLWPKQMDEEEAVARNRAHRPSISSETEMCIFVSILIYRYLCDPVKMVKHLHMHFLSSKKDLGCVHAFEAFAR